MHFLLPKNYSKLETHTHRLVTSLLVSIFCLGMATNAAAINKRAVTDTITSLIGHQATVGTVSVKQIKVNRKRVEVHTNPTLSYLSLRAGQTDSIKRAISTIVLGDPNGQVLLFTDGYEVSELQTSLHGKKRKTPSTHPEVTPLTRCASRAYSAPKGLDGRHIALWGSHGRYFNQQQQRWMWQRAKTLTTVEDLYTTSYVQPFLVPMLENAGAVVLQARERDRQEHEVIVDDDEANSGAWTHVVDGGWGRTADGLLYEGENPFLMGGYARCKASAEMPRLVYRPTLPEAGEYAVYVSYKTVENSTPQALYTVVHQGISTQYEVNQQMGGSTWVYLGTFAFGTDTTNNYVEVYDKGKGGHIITSDAIRWGGGMGNVARFAQAELQPNTPSGQENGTMARKNSGTHPNRDAVQDISYTSGSPRWLEGARYWFQYSGIPDSVYNYTGGKNDYTDDYASRGRWVNYLAGGSVVYPKGPGLHIPVDMGLAFHTDAGTTPDDTIVGTLLIYTDYDDEKKTVFPNGASRMLNRDYADYMQTQLVNDVRAIFAPEWHRRQLKNSSYSESRNPKVPMVLLEFLSHQNFADMKYGLDPSFRFVVSRAIYKAMLRFDHQQYGTPYVVQPLPVQRFRIDLKSDMQIQLTWAPREDVLEPTAKPTYYVLYSRTEGSDWDNGTRVNGTSTTLTLQAGKQYEYKVCAANEGGLSFPSEVLTACQQQGEASKVMIVNGFSRVSTQSHFQTADSTLAGFTSDEYAIGYMNDLQYIGEQYEFHRNLPWVSDDQCGFGTCYTDQQGLTPIGNTFDYPSKHGQVLVQMGYSFASCSADAADSIGQYDMLDLILGKQKKTEIGAVKKQTRYEVFPEHLRKAMTNFTGAIMASGSYIGSEMQSKTDQLFTSQVLHYTFWSDHATRSGEIGLLPRWQRELQAHIPAGSDAAIPGTIHLVTKLNRTTLPCEKPEALQAADKAAYPVVRYADTGTAAGIAYDGKVRTLAFGFALESLGNDFADLYTTAVRWLLKQ